MQNAEYGLIGAILVNSDSLFHVYNKLKPWMFADDFCCECYEAVLGMYDIGEDISLVSISQKMESNRWSKDYILSQLRTCFSEAPNSIEIRSYAQTIISEYKARRVSELFRQISLLPKDIDQSIAALLTELEALQSDQELKIKHLKQIVEENKEHYFTDSAERNFIKTGFRRLDDCLGGLEGGDVTVIGARPAVGKSAFVTQMIIQMALSGKRIGYFNLEMNDSQIYERMLSGESSIDLQRIRRAKSFLGGEKASFDKANDKLMTYDVIISSGGKTVSEIRAESRHQKFDVIVIDYMQLIRSDRNYSNRSSEVGEISKALKALAMELQVPIVLLSQLNRLAARTDAKEPDMSELRESGDIEQDASNILLLWNISEDAPSYKALKVEKQRQGEHMKEGLIFDGMHMHFDEVYDDFEKYKNDVRNNTAFPAASESDGLDMPW